MPLETKGLDKKPKNYISFSSFVEEKRWFTQVDLESQIIYITSDTDKVYTGTIDEFKNLVIIKANETDVVYESLLSMAEELIDILSRK